MVWGLLRRCQLGESACVRIDQEFNWCEDNIIEREAMVASKLQ